MSVLAFDIETCLLASEVEREYAAELAVASAWERPDLFGFACGVAVDIDTGAPRYYGPAQAQEMIAVLQEAEVTCGFNSAGFDLPVLSGYGDVSAIYSRHIDLRAEIKAALRASPDAVASGRKLYAGGLDAICLANDLDGKTGSGIDAPSLYREGRLPELLAYCEADVRLTASLYRLLGEGRLCVDPAYYSEGGERVQLGQRIPLNL